ncbi:MAG: hypothetical protein AABX14_04340 [Candidatus Aenigmatarchaeota archaeon]
MPDNFYRQLGTGVASLTFGVALSIFIYAAASGIVSGLQAWFLFATSFLLMLRFWWRYNELFVRFMPSRTFWHFLFDFAISFFGILTVLTVGDLRTWALLSALAMLLSAIRCGLSWHEAKTAKPMLKKTFLGAIAMLVIMGAVYALVPIIGHVLLAEAVFILVLIFVIYSSRK